MTSLKKLPPQARRKARGLSTLEILVLTGGIGLACIGVMNQLHKSVTRESHSAVSGLTPRAGSAQASREADPSRAGDGEYREAPNSGFMGKALDNPVGSIALGIAGGAAAGGLVAKASTSAAGGLPMVAGAARRRGDTDTTTTTTTTAGAAEGASKPAAEAARESLPTTTPKDQPAPVAATDKPQVGPDGKPCPGGVCPRGETGCFVAGTPVWTPNGPVPIEQIKLGDIVLSRDENEGLEGIAQADGEEELEEDDFGFDGPLEPEGFVALRVVDKDGRAAEVRAPEHQTFYSAARGWIDALSLLPGETLFGASGWELKVDSVESVRPMGDGVDRSAPALQASANPSPSETMCRMESELQRGALASFRD